MNFITRLLYFLPECGWTSLNMRFWFGKYTSALLPSYFCAHKRGFIQLNTLWHEIKHLQQHQHGPNCRAESRTSRCQLHKEILYYNYQICKLWVLSRHELIYHLLNAPCDTSQDACECKKVIIMTNLSASRMKQAHACASTAVTSIRSKTSIQRAAKLSTWKKCSTCRRHVAYVTLITQVTMIEFDPWIDLL